MVLDSPLPQFGPIWRKKSLSGRHFFLVRATMNIKPVLKSSWTKLKHRRCTKRPGELKHINILVLKKSILKKTKKKHGNKKVANFVHLTFSSTPNRAFKTVFTFIVTQPKNSTLHLNAVASKGGRISYHFK